MTDYKNIGTFLASEKIEVMNHRDLSATNLHPSLERKKKSTLIKAKTKWKNFRMITIEGVQKRKSLQIKEKRKNLK